MTVIAQGKCQVKLANASSTLVDITGQAAAATIRIANTVGSYAVFGGNWMNRTEGVRDATATLNVLATDGAAEASALVAGWALSSGGTPGARAIEIGYPDLTSTGSVKYSGDVLLVETDLLQGEAGGGNPQSLNVSLSFDGAISKAIVA